MSELLGIDYDALALDPHRTVPPSRPGQRSDPRHRHRSALLPEFGTVASPARRADPIGPDAGGQ